MITTTSADGTNVRAVDEGRGAVVLVLAPGLDDGSSWRQVAALLTPRFRVVRLHRRRYRLDITTDPPCSIAAEVDDVLATAKVIGEPLLLVGHSSGGVVALEAMAASPSTFTGAVIFEPPIVTDLPLGHAAIERAKAAVTAGKPTTAIRIFLRDIVRLPPASAWLTAALVALMPRYRAFVPRQIDDAAAIDQLGIRLDTYALIEVPTVLLGGDRSPAHLGERLDALARVMPHAERVVMHNRDHGAHLKAPKDVARVIETHADKVRHQPR